MTSPTDTLARLALILPLEWVLAVRGRPPAMRPEVYTAGDANGFWRVVRKSANRWQADMAGLAEPPSDGGGSEP